MEHFGDSSGITVIRWFENLVANDFFNTLSSGLLNKRHLFIHFSSTIDESEDTVQLGLYYISIYCRRSPSYPLYFIFSAFICT